MVKKRPKSRPVRVSAANTPRESSASESIDDDMFTTSNSTPQAAPSVLKVCRLCETKDGPFLNIFDADKVTSKRIDEVLPFTVAENDNLPHLICFRCSAKVEELYEFILKCIKTQENLQLTVGKKTPLVTKSRFRVQWEQQLNKKNISNDDICNALIKKAMEGIKDAPLKPKATEDSQPPVVNKKNKNSIEPPATLKKDIEPSHVSRIDDITYQSDQSDEHDDVKLKQQVKLSLEKCDNKVSTRSLRSKKQENVAEELAVLPDVPKSVRQNPSRKSQPTIEPTPVDNTANSKTKIGNVKQNKDNVAINNKSKGKAEIPEVAEKPNDPPPKAPEPPPINIMDHVSIIKVNSVGTLFLCKLCNRNFLKKELVLTHGCAKNNVPKDKFLHNVPPPREVPKPSTVKYIKMDKDFKKPVIPENKPVDKSLPPDAIKVNIPVQSDVKPKPKIGPASRVRNRTTEALQVPTLPSVESQVQIPKPVPPAQETKIVPEVKFPTLPSLNSRYKLVPGPNNTFTLVEDDSAKTQQSVPNPAPNPPPLTVSGPRPKSRKRKVLIGEENIDQPVLNQGPTPEVIVLDDGPIQPPSIQQPYPVGLFQTAHHSGGFAAAVPKLPMFTTPAMKKQSYTIVQTGNPSKLLISTKPQAPVEEPQRKKSKKSKTEETHLEHFNAPEEDGSSSKDAGFFTFINVDPLVQPSYVLPTNNIIQESQISTSTSISQPVVEKDKEKDKYSCNMCEETFSREKKLLSHIQSHFNRMDEEDQMRNEKNTSSRKRTRKS